MTLRAMIYLALVSATIASIESDDCALLSQREARYPAFAFTSPYAVVAPSTPALRVTSRSLDEFLPDDVPRFALTDAVPAHRAALARAGWTTCGVSTKPAASHLLRFVAFERILWLDVAMLAIGDLAPVFRMKLDARVALTEGAALVRPDAVVARLVNSGEEPWAGVSVQNLDAAGMLVRGDAARWDAETRKADAADAEKRSISEAHPAVIVTGYWSMPSKHGSREYATWIGHFVEVAVPMVIFTNAELELGEMRSKFGHGRLTKFVPREIDDFHTQRVFGETWKKDFARDREARLHKSPPVWKSTGVGRAIILHEVISR